MHFFSEIYVIIVSEAVYNINIKQRVDYNNFRSYMFMTSI